MSFVSDNEITNFYFETTNMDFNLNDSKNDSFRVIQKKSRARAIIDSDSESDCESHHLSDTIEDSLSGDESSIDTGRLQIQNDNIIETTDDEEEEDGGLHVSNNVSADGTLSHSFHNTFHSTLISPEQNTDTGQCENRNDLTYQGTRDNENVDDIIEDSGSVEVLNSSHDIVDVSSDDEVGAAQALIQPTIRKFLTNESGEANKMQVTPRKFKIQANKVSTLENDLQKAKNAIRVVDLRNLPDKGKNLLAREQQLENSLKDQKKLLDQMILKEQKPNMQTEKVEIPWDQIHSGLNAVKPKFEGKKGMATYTAQKELAVETLNSLHNSLDTRPTETETCEDPRGLKVPLMFHQKHALAWLLWREKQKPSGGLLADDMGLGKTLTMISLIMKSKEFEQDIDKENRRGKHDGGSLVICPASLINQWAGEITNRTKRGLLGVEVYHGGKRETKAKKLAQHDVVITTYSLVMHESEKDGPIYGVRWRRIILDESHQIRNFKSKTALAVFRISGKSRWALTGTPVHNKEDDMYAIMKFLRCVPFDEYQTWRHWITNKNSGGSVRLHAVVSSLMLRRTKIELMSNGSLESLPPRNSEVISITLEKEELDLYKKVALFSRTLFAQFLHQRAEKTQDMIDARFQGPPPAMNSEYMKMREILLKQHRIKDINQHHILLLLLRLRQICCHPYLIKEMISNEDLGDNENTNDADTTNLMEQLDRLALNENNDQDGPSTGVFNTNSAMFKPNNLSSKVKKLINVVKEKVEGNDKAIIVSQWTGLLNLIALQLKEEKICYGELNGKILVQNRTPIVDNFNNPTSPTKLLLLSLTAGGVGLNLVGANYLFLLDVHWNPQLENQAIDRIYRLGQKKTVFIYKFLVQDTIEERVKSLQDRKLAIANSVLTGSKQIIDNKLSINDLKMLFGYE